MTNDTIKVVTLEEMSKTNMYKLGERDAINNMIRDVDEEIPDKDDRMLYDMGYKRIIYQSLYNRMGADYD
jgi:hypothetical protein